MIRCWAVTPVTSAEVLVCVIDLGMFVSTRNASAVELQSRKSIKDLYVNFMVELEDAIVSMLCLLFE